MVIIERICWKVHGDSCGLSSRDSQTSSMLYLCGSLLGRITWLVGMQGPINFQILCKPSTTSIPEKLVYLIKGEFLTSSNYSGLSLLVSRLKFIPPSALSLIFIVLTCLFLSLHSEHALKAAGKTNFSIVKVALSEYIALRALHYAVGCGQVKYVPSDSSSSASKNT